MGLDSISSSLAHVTEDFCSFKRCYDFSPCWPRPLFSRARDPLLVFFLSEYFIRCIKCNFF